MSETLQSGAYDEAWWNLDRPSNAEESIHTPVSISMDIFSQVGGTEYVRKDDIVQVVYDILESRFKESKLTSDLPTDESLHSTVKRLSDSIEDINRKISSVCIQFGNNGPKNRQMRVMKAEELRSTLHPQTVDTTSLMNDIDKDLAQLELNLPYFNKVARRKAKTPKDNIRRPYSTPQPPQTSHRPGTCRPVTTAYTPTTPIIDKKYTYSPRNTEDGGEVSSISPRSDFLHSPPAAPIDDVYALQYEHSRKIAELERQIGTLSQSQPVSTFPTLAMDKSMEEKLLKVQNAVSRLEQQHTNLFVTHKRTAEEKLKLLSDRLNDMQKLMSTQEANKKYMEDKVRSMEMQYTVMSRQEEERLATLRQLSEENRLKREQLETIEKEKSEAMLRLKENQEYITTLMTKLNETEKKLLEKETNTVAQMQEQTATLKQIDFERQELRDRLSVMEAQIAEETAARATVEEEKQKLMKTVEKERKALVQKLVAAEKAIYADQANMTKEMAELRTKTANLSEEKSVLQRLLAEAQEEIKKLQAVSEDEEDD